MSNEPSVAERSRHWDAVYTARGAEGVSWYQPVPRASLELIEELQIPRDAAVIDIGGGASLLADCLVERHFSDVTVLDLSEAALRESQHRLGDSVIRLQEDVLDWNPPRLYDLWHDRALFHFLVTDTDRQRYVEIMRAALRPGGFVIVATFAADGPELCSGLPVTRYSVNDLKLVLGGVIEIVDMRRELHTTPRGASQPFTWLAGRIAPLPTVSPPRPPGLPRTNRGAR